MRRTLALLLLGSAGSVLSAPPEVAVVKPVEREIFDFTEVAGRLEASSTVEIRPRVNGLIQKVQFKEGSEVKKGDLLLEIDGRLQKAELAKAEAQVEQARAAATLADKEYQRTLQREKAKAVTKEEVEKAAANREAANAGLLVAKAALEVAKLNLEYTRIYAPIAGRIGRARVDEGNLVKENETLLTSIVGLDPMHVAFELDDRSLLRFTRLQKAKKDTKVSVQLGALGPKSESFQAEVDLIDPSVDPKTNTVRVRALLPNPKGELVPGLYVRVRVPTSEPRKALMIPTKSVFELTVAFPGEEHGVFVVDNNARVERRAVWVGITTDGSQEITKGLKANDFVVVDPDIPDLRHGLEVKPRVTPDAKPSSKPREGAMTPRPRPLPALPGSGPAIIITTVYPGATAQMVEDAVAGPIEKEVNGVEGATQRFVTCTDEGEMRMTISFKKGTDLNQAQVLVQNRVALAEPKLPEEVRRLGVTVRKRPVFLYSVALFSPDSVYDTTYLAAFAEKQLRDELVRVPGIADVQFYGDVTPAPQLRLAVDRLRMQALNMTLEELAKALRKQNLAVGVEKGDKIAVTLSGRLLEPEQLHDIVLKTQDSGGKIHLKDVATVEMARGYITPMKVDGKPCVVLLVSRDVGVDEAEARKKLNAHLAELAKDFPKGLQHRVLEE